MVPSSHWPGLISGEKDEPHAVARFLNTPSLFQPDLHGFQLFIRAIYFYLIYSSSSKWALLYCCTGALKWGGTEGGCILGKFVFYVSNHFNM